jgi:cation transport regulator ChaB
LRVQDCDECERLWEAYANATFGQVRAENALNMATALYEERDRRQSLERELEKASKVAEQCYETIAKHHAIAHPMKSSERSAAR